MRTAVLGLYHCFTLSLAHSTIIIIVSMAIPKASTKAKVDILLNVIHKYSTTINPSKNARGRIIVAMVDSLTPTKNMRAKNTRIRV